MKRRSLLGFLREMDDAHAARADVALDRVALREGRGEAVAMFGHGELR